MPHEHTPRVANDWPLGISPTLGGSFRPPVQRAHALTESSPAPAALSLAAGMRMPRFTFAPDSFAAAPASAVRVEDREPVAADPDLASWAAAPAAQAAERWIALSTADAMPAAIALRHPGIGDFPVGRVELAVASRKAAPAPYPAERWIELSLAADAIPAVVALRLLDIGQLAVDDTEPVAAAPLKALSACTTSMQAPAAQAAERWIALSPAAEAIPATIAFRQPEIGRLPVDGVQLDTASWMETPAPQAAERWITLSTAEAIPTPVAFHQPDIGKLAVASVHIRQVRELAPSLDPDVVSSGVRAVMNSRPASSFRGPTLIRFSMHAVDEIVPRLAAGQAPQMADARPGPWAIPVESMPAVLPHAPRALAFRASMVLPGIEILAVRVLPQAPAVAAPGPAAVESMPTTAPAMPAPVAMCPALRLPTLAKFRPAQDTSEALAAPMTAASPIPVESMPAAGALQALPLPARPALVARAFHADLQAQFQTPLVAGPAPTAAEPPAAQRQPAVLNPMSRIAAQPAGAQPERPAPAVPQPRPCHLEYFCQPLTSFPSKRIEPLPAQVALRHLPFEMAPALGNLLEKKSSRIVLPFEEIFANQKAKGPRRFDLSFAGKVAATVMVGIALWSGSRIANLSVHTERVASSKRPVAVTDSLADPAQRDFGTGTVAKVRRAIANRAATEMTDTFKTGMRAWGVGAQQYAAGWKRSAQGHVSTGEMALFQPSLKYTDYRMEFYGQIEDKSMGWVVRAQDKKNYYAMKFTVIEPGLRPIIAMAHYSVVNGKPGRKTQTPLSVMVHNNRPMHVAVDVRGNRFTASIDGERIDSWTDEVSAQGGVGFFSDPGEKARLYWMKLTRNQDWLGRFCAYLSNDGRQQTAEMWGPGIPSEPGPFYPRLPALALAAAGPLKIRKQRREAWTF